MNMQNPPWECPRCGRMNAPFNPACFCKADEVETFSGNSEHVMDAVTYPMGEQPIQKIKESSEVLLKRKYEAAQKIANKIQDMEKVNFPLPPAEPIIKG